MIRKVAALVAVVLLGAACAQPTSPGTAASPSDSASGPSSAPSSAPPQDETAPPGEVPATLDFEARTVSGGRFDGASLAGQPVLLWFWAPWCPTCRGQIPQVKRLAATHGDRVAVVGVAGLSDDDAAIAEFAAQVPGVTHLSDSAGEVWRHFDVAEQSSFVLLDANGAEVLTTGYGGSDELAARIAAVVRSR